MNQSGFTNDQNQPTASSAAVSPADEPAGHPASLGKRIPRVAIVGVHGVGAHAAGATENAMADLLFSLPATQPSDARPYGFFRSVGVQIPLQPVEVKEPPPPRKKGFAARVMNLYEEPSARFAELATVYGEENRVVERGAAGKGFMQMLLRGYKGGANSDAYITTRLEGKRSAKAPGGEADVHIYEVLWADLASPDSTILSFLLALFQLILHLASLSRLAIDTGSAENSGALWQLYLAMQRYAVRMLQIFIPLTKVVLLVVIFSCIPALLGKKYDLNWFPVVMFALAGIVIGFLILSRDKKPVRSHPWLWALFALVPGILGAAAGWILSGYLNPTIAGAIASWLFLGVPLLFYVLSNYEDVRKGVEITGWVVYAACFLIFAGYLSLTAARQVPEEWQVPQATFWTAEWLIASIRASWMLLIVFAFLALVLGTLACLRQKEAKRARVRAAVRTSQFALALPALLFLLITSMMWAGMFSIARWVHKPFFEEQLLNVPPGPAGDWLLALHLIPDPVVVAAQIPDAKPDPCTAPPLCPPSHADYLPGVLAWSVGYQLPITLALFGLALFLLGWWIVPGAITERFPLRDKSEAPRSSTNAQSVRLGTWNSRGLDAISVISALFWCAIFVAPLVFYFLPGMWQSYFQAGTIQIVFVWAGTFAIFGAAVAAIVRYGSLILRTVLDVDTYLRASPADATPRAQIMERYVSTLRYLARYRDKDGRGYDSVVIVAHSLGALISGDLLRFLYSDGDPDLGAFGLSGNQVPGTIPISLLTMGNPTRQLLNRFFPYLYDWVRAEPDNGLHPLPDPAKVPPVAIPDGMLPDPRELGVSRWLNAYRSGDYIGRSLWLEEWYGRTDGKPDDGRYPEPIHVVNGDRCTEMCIGAGAHTHYWDDTAPDVAELLNSLI